jgi:hypothetical protein
MDTRSVEIDLGLKNGGADYQSTFFTQIYNQAFNQTGI